MGSPQARQAPCLRRRRANLSPLSPSPRLARCVTHNGTPQRIAGGDCDAAVTVVIQSYNFTADSDLPQHNSRQTRPRPAVQEM
jgi:hypothetical protein